MREPYPEADFKFSAGWFDCFKSRMHISFRRTTNVSQHQPSDLESKICNFHLEIRRVAAEVESRGPLGQFTPSTIANVDQTPLPFIFNGGKSMM